MGTKLEKIAVFYTHFSKSKNAQKNYDYFIKNGIDTASDIYLGTCTKEIEKCKNYENVTLVPDNNSSTRIEAFNHLLASLTNTANYNYFIFVSSEMCGPFVNNQSSNAWTENFCAPLTGDTHLSGTIVRLLPQIHPLTLMFREDKNENKPLPYVPLNAFALTQQGLQIFIENEIFKQNDTEISDIEILNHDIKASSLILNKGWNISCVLEGYNKLDYRNLEIDPNTTSHHGDPSYLNAYFGKTASPSELMFSSRLIDQPKKTELVTPCDKLSLFHIYYDQATKESIPDGFKPLDNINGPSMFREGFPILKHLNQNDFQEDEYFGFFSPKFCSKTSLNASDINRMIDEDDRQSDVYLFTGHWNIAAMYTNVWVQGDRCHEGMLGVCQELANAAGYDVNLQSSITTLDHAVFSHFLIAKPNFWDEWKRVVTIYFDMICKNPSLKSKHVNYRNTVMSIHPFVIERVPTMILLCGKFRTYCDKSNLNKQIPLDCNLGDDLAQIDKYKKLYSITKNPTWLKCYKYFLDHYFVKFDEFKSQNPTQIVIS